MNPHQATPELNVADMAAFPEMNPAPVLRLALDGRVVLANRAAREYFRSESLDGVDWLATCPGISRGFWDVVTAGGTQPSMEADLGGRVVNFTYCLAPDRASVFVFGADVTEFRRAEERIEQYSMRMAEMARFPDMNPGPVLRTDRDGNIVLANVAALSLFGQGTLLGKCWWTVCPGMTSANWQGLLSSPEVVRHECVVGKQSFVFAHRVSEEGDLVFIYGNEVTQLRAAEEALRSAEKMATLGTLSAGVAHELNNPAAAAARDAEQLRDALVRLDEAFVPLSMVCREGGRMESLHALRAEVRERGGRRVNLDALDRSDREAALEEWLEGHDIDDGWELAPALVSLGYAPDALDGIATTWGAETGTVVRWMARAQPVYGLVKEIGEAAGRISEIVRALKTYSFLGQAPVRAVNIAEGLDSTLVIMRNKLKIGINVLREYAADLPDVEGFGGELNQVWTNLIDNAADAMDGKGTLTLRTASRDGWVSVEIEDSGPGIPADTLARIFDPFFTTKPVGRGTGLGLATVQSIVTRKHGGTIDVTSRPGCTRFTVRLPVRINVNATVPEGSSEGPPAATTGVWER